MRCGGGRWVVYCWDGEVERVMGNGERGVDGRGRAA